MTEREALKLALEALDYAGYLTEPESDLGCNCLICQATAAVKEALAQPEQELLAWKNAALRVGEDLSSIGPNGYYNMTAQQWLDWAMAQQPRGNNSLAQPEQGSVGEVINERGDVDWISFVPSVGSKLYTTPPQRTWVGLTKAQCGVLWKTNMTPFEYYQAIEDKLKEKNTRNGGCL